MSKLTFSTIPEVPLLLIFSKIPLHDLLLNVNLVNRHWNTISAVASQNRKRLVLLLLRNSNNAKFSWIITSVFTDPFDVSRLKWRYFGGEDHGFVVPYAEQRLNPQLIERLVERLPNIATLEVNLDELDISTSEHIATLINGWREHLVTLKLFTNYNGDGNQSLLDGFAQLTNLHTTINSLPVLHRLTYQLDFPFSTQNLNQIEPFTFPISCPSLRELYFTSRDFGGFGFDFMKTIQLFSNAFRDYVQSKEASELKKIAFHDQEFNRVDDHLSKSDVLSSKTTHIALYSSYLTETNLMEFSSKFYNLINIAYNIRLDFPINKLSKGLSVLSNLKHITFNHFGMENDNKFKEVWLQHNNSPPDRVLPQMNKIIPLTQIKSVYFFLRNIRWHQFLAEDLCFDLVFPNVELICIENSMYKCVHCGGYFDREERKTIRKSEWYNCVGTLLAPIAKCDKLKRIEYEDETDFEICCSLENFKLDWADFY